MLIKVFLSNTTNQNLQHLLDLDINELFEKFEHVSQAKTQNGQLEETLEALNDFKSKLNIQIEQRELYEKQHREIMDLLNISNENQCFDNTLQAIRDLKESLEQNESAHYEHAESILESFPSTSKDHE